MLVGKARSLPLDRRGSTLIGKRLSLLKYHKNYGRESVIIQALGLRVVFEGRCCFLCLRRKSKDEKFVWKFITLAGFLQGEPGTVYHQRVIDSKVFGDLFKAAISHVNEALCSYN
jgi:hypothetical protein